jgi:antitoxin component YwqK of YwqJK toxin-antitoxin module
MKKILILIIVVLASALYFHDELKTIIIPDGPRISYYDNGQLESKFNYKNGNREGLWVGYWDNGQLTYKGNWKNGKQEGVWVSYNTDGTVDKRNTGTFKNGEKVSD